MGKIVGIAIAMLMLSGVALADSHHHHHHHRSHHHHHPRHH